MQRRTLVFNNAYGTNGFDGFELASSVHLAGAQATAHTCLRNSCNIANFVSDGLAHIFVRIALLKTLL